VECDLDGVRLSYAMEGAGTPVLMIHGFSLDHHSMRACMEPVFALRPGRWMRIYLDLPGMGASPAPPWKGSSDRMLQTLLRFLDAVIPGRDFLVAGDSYGGYLARGIVHARPLRVLGLLLICPVILAPAAARDVPPLTVVSRDEELFAGLASAERADFSATAAVQTRRTWERFHAVIGPAVSRGDAEFLKGLHGEGYPYSFDVDDLEVPFLRPSLFLLGRQDSVVGYRDAWKLAVHYPRASYVVLDGAGHSLEVEQEALFGALTGEWLDRVEQDMQRRSPGQLDTSARAKS
jgi:pimeloyl-ACP methyl ester carboxylesterase